MKLGNKIKKTTQIGALALITALLGGTALEASAQTRRTTRRPTLTRTVKRTTPVKPRTATYRVDSGQTIRVRMNGTLSSKTAQVGDTFTTSVTEPVYADNGSVVIPLGSTVSGRVTSVRAARKGGNPGEIGVTFFNVRIPNGRNYAINGSLTSLDSDDAKSDNESTARGDKMKNRKLIFTGGGAGGGALIGAAIGGGKGALIGGIIGGVGGLITETQTKGENAEVKDGTTFGIYLNQDVYLPKFIEN